jgi:hypothetical protein
LFLTGDGNGNFHPTKAMECGLFADGDAKGMAEVVSADGEMLLIVGNNSGPTQAFIVKQESKLYQPRPDDAFALVTLSNGKTFRHEFFYGSTYLSESSRALCYSQNVVKIEVYTFMGERKEIVP